MTALNSAARSIRDWSIRMTGQIDVICSEIETVLTERGFMDKERFGVRLALHEALMNALKHGNGYDPAKSVRIVLTELTESAAEFFVEDDGLGFNPAEVPDPIDPENLERSSGRGLLIMRSYMSEVEYFPPGNKVRLLKRRQ